MLQKVRDKKAAARGRVYTWKGEIVSYRRTVGMSIAMWGLLAVGNAEALEADKATPSVLKVDTGSPAKEGRPGQIVLAQDRRRLTAGQRGRAGQQPAPRNLDELRNPDRPQGEGEAQEPIDIDFEDATLAQVIKMIGAQTGRNFDLVDGVGQETVTIIAHHKVPPELAFKILESILTSRGFEMVEILDGNLIRVQQRGKSPEKIQIGKGTEPPTEPFDQPITRVIPVQYAKADEVVKILLLVGSDGAEADVYQPTNTIIMRDTADGVRNMLELLEVIDIAGSETTLEVFTLEYERAENIVNIINEVLTDTGSQPGQGGGVQRAIQTRAPRTTVRPAVGGQQQTQIIGQREEVLRIVPDERLNALIVVATATRMQQVRDLIDHLDTPIDYESDNMHIRELLNADAEAVEEALSALTGTAPRSSGQQGGQGGGGEVQPFEKSVSISRYEQTNALIIVATPQDYRKIERIIQQLDVPRRQVSVEAIIMQVSVNNSHELTVEAAGLTANDAFALNNVVNLAAAIAGGPFALAGLGATVGILDGTTQITVPTGIDPTTGTPTGVSVQTIPNVPLLLRALETITNVEVLSTPNLLTLDNETSSIIVGQQIPLISTLQDTNNQTGFLSRARVQREDVGVEMEVTPQINEGDYVSMEISVSVTEPVISSIGIDVNQSGATLNKAEIVAQIVVGDGQTAIIGGLLSEGVDKTVNQTPILGDLPLIGWLFRSKRSAWNKQNLVVLVTPHIIKQGHDLERITDYRVAQFYQRNLDALFADDGFIKKIKRKHRLRTKYRPTEKHNPQSSDAKAFERGDIKR